MRFAEWFVKRRYRILFFSLIATFVAAPVLSLLGRGRVLLDVLLCVSLLGASSIGPGRRRKWLIIGLVLLTPLASLGAEHYGSRALPALAWITWVGLALFAAAGCLRFAYRSHKVDTEHVFAVFCAYLLAGVFLGLLHQSIERILPGSYQIGGAAIADFKMETAVYFSFVCLTTVGFGDIVPVSALARSAAIAEAILGQLYIAVIVAGVVSKFRPETHA